MGEMPFRRARNISLNEIVGHVLLEPAHPEVVVHHAGAGHRLEQALDALPPPEAEHRRRHRAGVQTHGGHEQQVAGDAVQLAENHPDIFRPFRDLQAHKLLNSPAIDLLVIEVGDVVQPVEEGRYLVVLLPLAELLGTPVEVADVGHHVDDFLAVDPQHHAKHAVGRGMLRAHIEQHLNRFGVSRWGYWVGGRFSHSRSEYSVGIVWGFRVPGE